MRLPFRDRTEAGRLLGAALQDDYAGRDDVIVLALPRGGVPVGFEVARALGADLDLLIVRKLGAPGHSELALGAIASGGSVVMNPHVVESLQVTAEQVAAIRATESNELKRRETAYRGLKPRPALRGKTVIVVDDGIATGATLRAGIKALRDQSPRRVVVAVPVAPADTIAALERETDALVCLATPAWFNAVGQFYVDFAQVSDEEVRRLLALAWSATPAGQAHTD